LIALSFRRCAFPQDAPCYSVDALRSLIPSKEVDLYAQLQFTEEDVKKVHAEFIGRSYYAFEDDQLGEDLVYVPAEGKAILLFTKAA